MPKDINADIKLQITEGKPVELPNGEFVANAQMTREGADLHLTSPDGQTVIIEGYFAQGTPPDLFTQDGARLSPALVDSFVPPERVGQYAAAGNSVNDASPAGKITEISGEATVVRADGTKVPAAVGTPVYQGDVVETSKTGAVNIQFADNTTFAISESARMSVDKFIYDSSAQSGSSFFSMLQGVFVYTSGLIGKADPGNVNIETPVGSIGIRGTVVAGQIAPAGTPSKITILDGAITFTNGAGTHEMHDSFNTVALNGYQQAPTDMGRMDAQTFNSTFKSISAVANDTVSHFSNSAPATSDAPAQNGSNNNNANGNNEGQQGAPAPGTAPDSNAPPAGQGANGQPGAAPAEGAPAPAPEGAAPPAGAMPPAGPQGAENAPAGRGAEAMGVPAPGMGAPVGTGMSAGLPGVPAAMAAPAPMNGPAGMGTAPIMGGPAANMAGNMMGAPGSAAAAMGGMYGATGTMGGVMGGVMGSMPGAMNGAMGPAPGTAAYAAATAGRDAFGAPTTAAGYYGAPGSAAGNYYGTATNGYNYVPPGTATSPSRDTYIPPNTSTNTNTNPSPFHLTIGHAPEYNNPSDPGHPGVQQFAKQGMWTGLTIIPANAVGAVTYQVAVNLANPVYNIVPTYEAKTNSNIGLTGLTLSTVLTTISGVNNADTITLTAGGVGPITHTITTGQTMADLIANINTTAAFHAEIFNGHLEISSTNGGNLTVSGGGTAAITMLGSGNIGTINAHNDFDLININPVNAFTVDASGRILVNDTMMLSHYANPNGINLTITATDSAGHTTVLTPHIDIRDDLPGVKPIVSQTNNLMGTSGADMLVLVGNSNLYVSGGGGADVILGNSGNNVIQVVGTNFKLIDGGLGFDTLKLGNSTSTTADYNNSSVLGDVRNIEKIDLGTSTGNFANTVRLSVADVFDMTGGNHTLTVGNYSSSQTGNVVINFTTPGANAWAGDTAFAQVGSQDMFNAGNLTQDLTFVGTYHGQTVTLVVHQETNASAGNIGGVGILSG